MHLDGILSTIVAGVVIGLLGRLVAPGRQAVGCVMTVVAGIVGAALGLYVGVRADLAYWPTVAVQVAVAAILVSVLARAGRR